MQVLFLNYLNKLHDYVGNEETCKKIFHISHDIDVLNVFVIFVTNDFWSMEVSINLYKILLGVTC